MYDAYGDGWSGTNYYVTTDIGDTVATNWLQGGYANFDSLCLPTGCYDISVAGGTYQSEVSFDFGSLIDQPIGDYFAVSVGGATCVAGCTDAAAQNYDATATVDDGSCNYCTDNVISAELYTDYYANENSWSVTDANGDTVMSGAGAGYGYQTFTETGCLPDGCYMLNFADAYGDGWCLIVKPHEFDYDFYFDLNEYIEHLNEL